MTDVIRADEPKDSAVIRVAANTPAGSLASAIAHGVVSDGEVFLRAVGAGPVNQAVKAIAIAQKHVATHALTLYARPGFTTVTMPDGVSVSAIVMRVHAN